MIKTNKIIVNQAAICDCLGLDSSQVNKLENDGVIIKESHNKYNLVKSVRNYINSITGRESSNSSGADYYAERARLTKAQADERELKVKIAKGELVYIDRCEQIWCDAAILLRNNILAVPPKVCRKASTMTNQQEIEELIKGELINALTSADIDPQSYRQTDTSNTET